jgi:uncharacterized RDD family membrane protein YckC
MLYEGVLLFGVLMVAGLLYLPLTQQRHALQGRFGLQAFLFVVLGIYFVWFWSRGGQTVAMKTWQIRLLTREGRPVTQPRAFARYLLAWLWFVPALIVARAASWHEGAGIYGALLAGMAVYALLGRWLPDQQFLHDRLCGTRLVHAPHRPKPRH